MRIEKKGKIPKWELEVTCDFCNTVLTLEGAKDMFAKEHGSIDSIDMDCYHTYHCICPFCKKEIRVPGRKIRDDIIEKIKVKN